MLVIASKEGQFANRIWHASNFIVSAFENNYSIKHLYLDEFADYFSESFERYKHLIHADTSPWKKRFFKILVKLTRRSGIQKILGYKVIVFDKTEESYNLRLNLPIQEVKKGNVVVSGWLFRDEEGLKMHKDLLRQVWTPDKEYIERVDSYVSKYRSESDILIGVHVRRGDYRNFLNGKWFYSIEQYNELIEHIASLPQFAGKKLGFVICSNDNTIKFKLAEHNIYFEQRHFVEDVYLLSHCDYITGPPSTFSMWASYYGDVPMYMVKDITSKPEYDNFMIYNFNE